MTTITARLLQFLTFVGLVCLFMVWTTFFIWLKAFDAGTSQSERVQIFLSYFPSSVSLNLITLLTVILCIAGIIISSICLRLKDPDWKIMNMAIIIGCGLRFLLQLFWLM
jgi:hypothetical protein